MALKFHSRASDYSIDVLNWSRAISPGIVLWDMAVSTVVVAASHRLICATSLGRHMPRYLFHVHDRTSRLDEDGLEFPDLESARREAVLTCGDIH